MRKFISTIWNAEPVVFLGIVAVVVGGVATAGLIPIWIAPIVTGIATVLQRSKVTPTR